MIALLLLVAFVAYLHRPNQALTFGRDEDVSGWIAHDIDY